MKIIIWLADWLSPYQFAVIALLVTWIIAVMLAISFAECLRFIHVI